MITGNKLVFFDITQKKLVQTLPNIKNLIFMANNNLSKSNNIHK